MPYLFLGLAIVAEVIGTSALKASEEFSRIGPSIIVILGYGAAFYFLSIALSDIQVGVAYGVWAGLGIVLITIIGALFFKQIPDLPAIFGLLMIIVGVVVIHVFSKTASH